MKHPFTAVAIRYVHDPRTEEFLNIGLVPILLILAALGVALWQRARRSSANAQPVGE